MDSALPRHTQRPYPPRDPQPCPAPSPPRRQGRGYGRALLSVLALTGGIYLARHAHPSSLHAPSVAHAARLAGPHAHRVSPLLAATVALPPHVRVERPPVADSYLPTDTFGERSARGLNITGATSHRLILFTFDDGPDRSTTPELLDRLDAAGVHAVFFLAGDRIRGDNQQQRDQAKIARDEVRRGHLVGNHTVDHRALPTLDSSVILEQLDASERIFQDVFGERPWLFRPPYGVHSERTDYLVESHGYTIILWNLGTGDPQVRSAEDVHTTWSRVFARRELENGERGGVVLLHDTHQWSVEGFTLIYDDLMARNCKLLEEGAELYDIVDDPSLFFAARNGAPAGTEAPPADVPAAVLAARQARVREATERRCHAVAAR